jgi:S1-C subfamily serine protease
MKRDKTMKTNRMRGAWVAVALALLLLPGCDMQGTRALSSASPAASTPTTETTVPTLVPPLSNVQEAVNALEAQFIAVYEAASPAVVNITNRTYVYNWFRQAVPQEGTGSGFVYDAQGHIVTNYHVVENAEELLVTLADGSVHQARIVGQDPTNDLAVLRIDESIALPHPLPVGDSDQLRVGQFVVAIGNPFGLDQTLTTGVISALGRVIESPEDNDFIGEAIQTDAAINPGNSGGPLLDLQGRVIGVNSQIVSTSGANAGIGFAVSANTVRRVVPELIARGHYPHPWLGVQMASLTPSTASVLREAGMDGVTDRGVLVLEVVRGGPADKAGIRGGSRSARIGRYQVPLDGDIITGIDGRPLEGFQALTVYLETETNVGDTVQLTIMRDGEEWTLPVTLGKQPLQR